jgi:predicted O-methyltransferase YrrM
VSDSKTQPTRGPRAVWERIRPFPVPRYVADTPRIGGEDPLDPFLPPTALTLGAAAMSELAARFADCVLGKLTPGDEHAAGRYFYQWSQAKFGKHWRYADILTTLWAAATFFQPRSYLEIGVCRGRSAAVVGAVCPQCAVYGFDLWTPDYAGAANPGPEFVRGELRAAGHEGSIELISGNSRETLPGFLREHPDLYFEIMTIDGDKSVPGFATDLATALPRLKVGGIVVCDDLPVVPVLRRLWEKVVERDSRYVTWEFAEGELGVAAAIRMA